MSIRYDSAVIHFCFIVEEEQYKYSFVVFDVNMICCVLPNPNCLMCFSNYQVVSGICYVSMMSHSCLFTAIPLLQDNFPNF